MKVDDRVMRRLVKKLGKLAKKPVKVGVLSAKGGDERTDDGKSTMVELATVHEFGSSNGIPERSFIRSTFEDPETKRDQAKVSANLAHKIVEGNLTLDRALDALGQWGVSRVKWRIKNKRIKQELSPATVAAKGSTTALVDTGRLINAINHEVE